jgi:Tfp pilus assembly pilus retraction ATPase PilT
MAGITLSELLKKMIEMGGSDLHLSTNSAPRIRVHGKLRPLDMPPLTAADTKALAYSVLTDVQKHRLRGKPRAGLLLRLEEPGAFPRQHLPPARSSRRRLPYHSMGNQDL